MQLSTNKILGYDFSLQYGCELSFFLGFSEIWSNQLKLLCKKSHGGTEGTEVRVMLRRCDGRKRNRGVVYSFVMTLGINALYIIYE